MTRIADMARGHWQMLLPELGVDRRFLRNVHGPCPICGGDDRFRWDNQHGGGGYICNGCGAGDGFDLASRVTGRGFSQLAEDVERLLGIARQAGPKPTDNEEVRQRNAMRRLWEGGRPVADISPVANYLRSRMVLPEFMIPSLREHPGVYADDMPHPALMAKVVTHDDKAVNLHLTLVTAGGQKATVQRPRRVMPGKLPDGCAIRLGSAAPEMGVAEGIETALSAAAIYRMPVWACINGNLLAKWRPPQIAERVYIFGDNDANFTGQAKAYHLANRLEVQLKVKCAVFVPDDIGDDWNDVLMARAAPKTGSGGV